MRLYPPVINKVLPSKILNLIDDKIDIEIPFQPSLTMPKELNNKNFKLKVTSPNEETKIYEKTEDSVLSSNNISFLVDATYNDYYTIQLGYIYSTEVVWSTVGKIYICIAQASVCGEGDIASSGEAKVYYQIKDDNNSLSSLLDPIVSYKYELFDQNNKLLEEFNSVKTSVFEEFYPLNIQLSSGRVDATIHFQSGAVLKANSYIINGLPSNELNEDTVISNIETKDGYNKIHYAVQSADLSVGLFRNKIGTSEWYLIHQSNEMQVEFNDYTITNFAKYQYALQSLFTSTQLKIYEKEIQNNYEDIYITDGQRMLSIKFNPKVSSFKKNIKENRVETLGSKYPFVYRDGDIDYRELGFGGLISYYLDKDDETFITMEELGLQINNTQREATSAEKAVNEYLPTTNIVNYNVEAEKRFRLEVEKWLTDNAIKLFKSPKEGDYLVKVMSVGLTPQETLARMIYDMSATACEVAENIETNYLKFGLMGTQNYDLETATALVYNPKEVSHVADALVINRI